MQLAITAAAFGRAVEHCAHCGNPLRSEPSLAFYQSAAAVFAVLLLTGVAGELREIRIRLSDAPAAIPKALTTYLLAIAAVMVLIVSGELVALAVLLTGSPSQAEQILVAGCLVIGVPGIPILMVLSLWERPLGDLVRPARFILVGLLLAVVAAIVYLGISAIRTTPPTYDYHVFGTCVAGSCGLNERSRPTIKSRRLGQLRDGDIVRIVCQVPGGKVSTPEGITSRIWDRLSNGHYISDVSVDTPPIGNQIPACPPSDPNTPDPRNP